MCNFYYDTDNGKEEKEEGLTEELKRFINERFGRKE